MTKNNLSGSKYYPLNFSQIAIRMQLFFSRHKQVLQLPITLITDHVFDFDILKKAVSLEMERNDCMRMQFIRKGGKLMQYFLPEYDLPDIKIYDFSGKTKEEQDAVILADARRMVRFTKNELYRIFFFKTYNGGSGIYINVTHMCMDATAVFLFYKDLLNIYFALVNGKELPKQLDKFEDCLPMDIKKLQNKEHQAKNKEFFRQQYTKNGEPFYAAPFGMSLLNEQRKKKKNPNLRACRTIDIFHDKSVKTIYHEGPEFVSRVKEFCKREQIPEQALFQFAIRTYLSAMNEFNPDISVFIYVNMRFTLADKNSGGTRASCIPMRSIITEDVTVREAMSKVLEEMFKVFRHCDYSLLDMSKLLGECYGTKLGTSYTSMMANYVPLEFEQPEDGWKFEAKWEQIGWFPFALYMLMIPSLTDNGMDFYYDYQINRMDEAMIENMHKMVIKVVNACIEKPDITVGHLLHEEI